VINRIDVIKKISGDRMPTLSRQIVPHHPTREQCSSAFTIINESGDTHEMTDTRGFLANRALRAPDSAAIAGIIFAVLYFISYTLIQLSIPAISTGGDDWFTNHADKIALALSMVPFAGIAFLWFMGVIRDRQGFLEDQFFSTLFFGSGILFLAMIFVSSSLAGGMLTVYSLEPDTFTSSGSYAIVRAVMFRINTNYAIRMAGMFMVVLGTIWVRTRVMPRWLALITYVLALVLLISIGFSHWITMIFPAWVLLISVYILILNYRPPREVKDSRPT
jgi:hypothetical protein